MIDKMFEYFAEGIVVSTKATSILLMVSIVVYGAIQYHYFKPRHSMGMKNTPNPFGIEEELLEFPFSAVYLLIALTVLGFTLIVLVGFISTVVA